jgi:hypothetical protein
MLQRIFSEGVAPLLAPLGFDSTPQGLRKVGGGYVWVIEQQAHDGQRFGVGLGVHYPDLAEAGSQGPVWEMCAHQTTLAELSRRKNFLWSVRAKTDVKRTIEEVTVLLLEVGLPWLQERKDWRSVLTDPRARYRDCAARRAD